MSVALSTLGRPGITTAQAIGYRFVSMDGKIAYKPGGGLVKGTKARDIGNTDETNVLRPGLLMAQHPTTKDYANWVIGVSTGALAGTGTEISVSAAQAAELVRRVGATGTFVLTGPEAASGTVQQKTVTYSAVNTTTGAITITALGANQVERVRFNIASTAGNLQLNVAKPDGTFATTANIAWNATDATYLASINSALDTATGVVGGIVATAIAATDTDLGFTLTYSGTGYAGKAWREARVIVMPTSSTEAMYEPVTAAVQGAFIAGSILSEANYSTPKTLIGDDNFVRVPLVGSTGQDTDWPRIPMEMYVDVTKVINYPSDASLKTWVKGQLSTAVGNSFTFSDEV